MLTTITSCFFISIYMRPSPPRSTLFPYTTLFRSVTLATSDEHGVFHIHPGPGECLFQPLKTLIAMHQNQVVILVDERLQRDRKSTRLNSSHGYISYAVFCLKKKTQSSDFSSRSEP